MSLDLFINKERLDIYVQHLKITPAQAMSAYHWNKALCWAMLPALQCLEVTLRNALDHAIRTNPPPLCGRQTTTGYLIFPVMWGTKRIPKIMTGTNARIRKKQPSQGMLRVFCWINTVIVY